MQIYCDRYQRLMPFDEIGAGCEQMRRHGDGHRRCNCPIVSDGPIIRNSLDRAFFPGNFHEYQNIYGRNTNRSMTSIMQNSNGEHLIDAISNGGIVSVVNKYIESNRSTSFKENPEFLYFGSNNPWSFLNKNSSIMLENGMFINFMGCFGNNSGLSGKIFGSVPIRNLDNNNIENTLMTRINKTIGHQKYTKISIDSYVYFSHPLQSSDEMLNDYFLKIRDTKNLNNTTNLKNNINWPQLNSDFTEAASKVPSNLQLTAYISAPTLTMNFLKLGVEFKAKKVTSVHLIAEDNSAEKFPKKYITEDKYNFKINTPQTFNSDNHSALLRSSMQKNKSIFALKLFSEVLGSSNITIEYKPRDTRHYTPPLISGAISPKEQP